VARVVESAAPFIRLPLDRDTAGRAPSRISARCFRKREPRPQPVRAQRARSTSPSWVLIGIEPAVAQAEAHHEVADRHPLGSSSMSWLIGQIAGPPRRIPQVPDVWSDDDAVDRGEPGLLASDGPPAPDAGARGVIEQHDARDPPRARRPRCRRPGSPSTSLSGAAAAISSCRWLCEATSCRNAHGLAVGAGRLTSSTRRRAASLSARRIAVAPVAVGVVGDRHPAQQLTTDRDRRLQRRRRRDRSPRADRRGRAGTRRAAPTSSTLDSSSAQPSAVARLLTNTRAVSTSSSAAAAAPVSSRSAAVQRSNSGSGARRAGRLCCSAATRSSSATQESGADGSALAI